MKCLCIFCDFRAKKMQIVDILYIVHPNHKVAELLPIVMLDDVNEPEVFMLIDFIFLILLLFI